MGSLAFESADGRIEVRVRIRVDRNPNPSPSSSPNPSPNPNPNPNPNEVASASRELRQALGLSPMERLERARVGQRTLRVQYRMPPELLEHPSRSRVTTPNPTPTPTPTTNPE